MLRRHNEILAGRLARQASTQAALTQKLQSLQSQLDALLAAKASVETDAARFQVRCWWWAHRQSKRVLSR